MSSVSPSPTNIEMNTARDIRSSQGRRKEGENEKRSVDGDSSLGAPHFLSQPADLSSSRHAVEI